MFDLRNWSQTILANVVEYLYLSTILSGRKILNTTFVFPILLEK